MKKLIVIACAFLAFALTASAQFMNSGSASSAGKPARTKAASSQDFGEKFGTFSLTYSPFNLVSEYDGDTEDILDDGMNALSLTWTNAHNVLATQPLYVEYGLGLQWSFWSESDSEEDIEYKSSVNFLSLKVPVSVVYDFAIPSTPVSVAPYLGLNLTGYLLGQQKASWKYTGEYADYMDEASGEEKTSFFSKDDMGDAKFSRFILGWHIGARVGFNKYFFGIGYEGPLTNFYKEGKGKIYSNQVNISLGLKF